MVPINIKLRKPNKSTVEFLEGIKGRLTQSFPGEQGELGLYFVLFVEGGSDKVIRMLEANANIEYAELAPLRGVRA